MKYLKEYLHKLTFYLFSAQPGTPFILLCSITWITFIFILATACNTTEPSPKIEGTISLTVEDVSSTEAWLNIKLQNVNLPAELKLFREDSVTRIFNPSISDTLLYEEGLLPNQTYTYKVTIQAPNKTTIQSKAVTLTTMDTTSHNFTWQTYTFGGANGSSVLNDVAIINENDIWAVGEIHTAETDQFDSNGVWVDPYNAVHWDGNNWELKRIIVNFRGNSTFIPLEGIFAFSSNNIWVVGSLPIHGDGNNWEIYDVREITNSNLSLSKAWGTSSNNMYFVGRGGSIAHYNGSGWTKIESRTGAAIQDIWGINNIISSEKEIYISVPTQYSVYKLDGQNNINRLEIGDNRFFRGIWTKNGLKVYVAGFGIVSGVLGKWTVEIEGNQLFFKDVKGDGNNNIFAAGANGEAAVFNGIRWVRYNEITNNNILYEKVAVKKNTVTAVGEVFGNEISGFILIGHRN